jgi:photosystem II stability/assembly factor-like uncharacterized protein
MLGPGGRVPQYFVPCETGFLIYLRVVLSLVVACFLCACRGTSSQSTPVSSHWVPGPAVGELNLLAVDLIDDNNAWAVGDIALMNGAVLRTSDGGRTWRAASSSTEILAAVHFVSPTRGWVAGYAGRIQSTDDGGSTWRVQRAENQGEVLNSIFFADEKRGWAVGGSGLILSTADGGNSWNAYPTRGVEDLWSVRFSPNGSGCIVGEDGLILTTTDRGLNWVRQTSGTSRALLGIAISPNFTVIVGEGGLILRSEDLKNWSPVESHTTQSLNSVAVSNSVCWGVGSQGATVGSTDGGKSWQQVPAVMAHDLLAVDMNGAAHGVAVGRKGSIQLLEPE